MSDFMSMVGIDSKYGSLHMVVASFAVVEFWHDAGLTGIGGEIWQRLELGDAGPIGFAVVAEDDKTDVAAMHGDPMLYSAAAGDSA
jgi:hypothetical protein